jgi:hypothetical protein
MQHSVLNRAAIEAANTTEVSGRVTGDSIKHGLYAKKQSILWRLTIFGCAFSVGVLVSLAPTPAQAQGTSGTVLNRISALEAEVATLQSQVSSLQTSNATLQSQVTALQNQLTAAQPVLALAPFVSVDPNPENGVIGPNIKFTGANIHVLSGSNSTTDNGNATGLGNLIIGYDDDKKFGVSMLGPGDRGGSHNLVIGDHNIFTKAAFGGLVAGGFNAISNQETVCFGDSNSASGLASTVCGGGGNNAKSLQSVVCGGIGNAAGNSYAAVTGGTQNTANGDASVIIGGLMQTTSNFNQILPQPPFP